MRAGEEPAPPAALHLVTHVHGPGTAFVAGRDVVFQGPAPRALAGLPTVPGVLIDRSGHLAALRELLSPGPGTGGARARTRAARGPAPVTTAPLGLISGFAGSGKTALAVAAAREALEAGWFGGGVVYVDLDGAESAGGDGSGALGRALRLLGVREADLPASLPERVALYRSLLQERVREHGPVLVVADNAVTAAQVARLAPGDGGHRLLATSREVLPGLGARVVEAAPLDASASFYLMQRTVEQTGRSRATAIADLPVKALGYLSALVESTGGLPRTVIALAHAFSDDPGLTAGALHRRLTGELDGLTRGEPVRHPLLAAARRDFEDAFLKLAAEPAGLLPLLGLNTGPDITTAMASALADLDADETRARLAALARAHLVAEEPPGSHRWRLPAHVRRDVRALALRLPEPVRRDARERLWDAFTHRAVSAVDDLDGSGSEPEREAAEEWFRDERPNLIAAVEAAADAGADARAAALAVPLCLLLLEFHLLDDLDRVSAAGLAAARRAGDTAAEGTLTNRRGLWLRARGRHTESLDWFIRARELSRAAGDGVSAAKALGNIANLHLDRGDIAQAGAELAVVVREFRALGDRLHEAGALHNRGNAHQRSGEYDSALRSYREAAAIHRERGDTRAELQELNAIGSTLHLAGDLDAAQEHHLHVARRGRELGAADVEAEARVSGALILLRGGTRQQREGIALLLEAAGLYERVGDRRALAATLRTAGEAVYETRDYDRAVGLLEQSSRILLTELRDTEAAGEVLGLEAQARRAAEGLTLAHRLGLRRTPHVPASQVRPARVTDLRPPAPESPAP